MRMIHSTTKILSSPLYDCISVVYIYIEGYYIDLKHAILISLMHHPSISRSARPATSSSSFLTYLPTYLPKHHHHHHQEGQKGAGLA